MKCWWKHLLLLILVMSFGSGLYSQDRYDYIYPFTMFQSFYGIEHQNDAYSSMNNPALAAMLDHDGKGAFTVSYNDWFIYSPLSIGALIPLNKDMDLGLSLNYIDMPVMYGCIIGYGEQQFYSLSSAITYNKVLDVSLGFSAKLFHDEYNLVPGLSEVINYYDFDAGVLIQLPLMKAANKEKVNLFDREMDLEITPGVQAVWINIKQDAFPRLSAHIKGSLYDTKLRRDLLDLVFSYGDQFGIKFGMMDLINLYIEKMNPFGGSYIYELEMNCSQCARDVFALINKKQIKRGFFAQSDILISYGTWDLTTSSTRNNVNVSLKFDF
jgi:hypothetical protein